MSTIIQRGSSGHIVAQWQIVVGVHGDGKFGPATEAATKAWQARNGLAQTGVVTADMLAMAGLAAPPVGIVQGTDVSALQGRVPWAALAKLGHRFSYLRCQVGNQLSRDARFLDNAREAPRNGIYPGAYYFPFPLPHLDATKQAHGFFLAAHVDGHAIGSVRDELPPAMDLEWPPPEKWGQWKCTADQIVTDALDGLVQIESDFATLPILYSYPYFLQALSKARRFRELLRYPLWIAGGAQYINGHGRVPDMAKEKPPRVVGWERDVFCWQYDGNGGLRLPNGVDVDGNVFLGDEEALERFCAGAMPRDVPVGAEEQPVGASPADEDDDDDTDIHAHRQARSEQIVASAA